MNTTERVIREQFRFLREAPTPPAFQDRATTFVIVGCGTSYHLAQSIAASFNLRGLRAMAVPGGEWSRRRAAYHPDGVKTHVIGLSRSGESTETVQALEVSRTAGYGTTAVTCEQGSSITKAADTVIFAATHPDEGIVMTASASLMLLVGLRLAGIAVGEPEVVAAEAALDAFEAVLPAMIEGRDHPVLLGAGALYGIAAEGGIKLQEMSLSHVQAYHPMEYRHGPISLIDDRSLAVLLYSAETHGEEVRIAAEVQDKGARVIGLGGPGDVSLDIGGSLEARSLVVLPILQLLGERAAEARGLDTGAPRHLNKVVVLDRASA
ncbi:SIS domain-containing protein [Lichenihabitans sp. Uapishka_5]|uniref:SIS domain-containing protein n=1 Tax=Lichenihabitans sp. Uapishka_5 TaxID=3037302 RepID=UPI0029E7CE2A|nr:SIS domain-containing protein [Lichenihabitans sp. Uapishka_5]MDX7950806.1 SIS domain-containing protein [Lichenihabitans sp. Uapishka_5]